MKILIVYATYSGSTQAAGEFLSQILINSKHQVAMKPVSEISFENILNYDLCVFASPSWDFEGKEGQPHQDFIDFINKSKDKKITGKSCAIMGLGDSSYAHFCGAVPIIEDFIKNTGGILKVESLKIDGYLYNTEDNNKKISEWAKKLTS